MRRRFLMKMKSAMLNNPNFDFYDNDEMYERKKKVEEARQKLRNLRLPSITKPKSEIKNNLPKTKKEKELVNSNTQDSIDANWKEKGKWIQEQVEECSALQREKGSCKIGQKDSGKMETPLTEDEIQSKDETHIPEIVYLSHNPMPSTDNIEFPDGTNPQITKSNYFKQAEILTHAVHGSTNSEVKFTEKKDYSFKFI